MIKSGNISSREIKALIYNAPKWSDILSRILQHCVGFFKICLMILRRCTLEDLKTRQVGHERGHESNQSKCCVPLYLFK